MFGSIWLWLDNQDMVKRSNRVVPDEICLMFVALQVIDCCRSYLALVNRSLLLENTMYHATGHLRYQYENASRRASTRPAVQVKGKSARR